MPDTLPTDRVSGLAGGIQYGIAANVIGKHRRTEVRMWRALARTGTDPAAEGHAGRVDNRVSAVTVQRELAAAVAGLSAGDWDVLLLSPGPNCLTTRSRRRWTSRSGPCGPG